MLCAVFCFMTKTVSVVPASGQGFGRIDKFGHADDVGATTTAFALWAIPTAAPYNFPASALTMYASSDDNADTATITIQGLDTNYQLQEEDIVLSGFSFVASTKQYLRVHRAFTKGATAFAGNVYISSNNTDAGADGIPDVLTAVHAFLEPEFQQTQQAIYTVPDGHIAQLHQIAMVVSRSAGTGDRDVEWSLMVREFGGVFRSRQHFHTSSAAPLIYPFAIPKPIPAKSDILIRIHTVVANSTSMSGEFDIKLEEIE